MMAVGPISILQWQVGVGDVGDGRDDAPPRGAKSRKQSPSHVTPLFSTSIRWMSGQTVLYASSQHRFPKSWISKHPTDHARLTCNDAGTQLQGDTQTAAQHTTTGWTPFSICPIDFLATAAFRFSTTAWCLEISDFLHASSNGVGLGTTWWSRMPSRLTT